MKGDLTVLTFNVPDINPTIEIDTEPSIDLLLVSIAFEKLGLAHIISAEAEKVQLAIGALEGMWPSEPPSLTTLLTINQSVEQVLRNAIEIDMLLAFKLEDVKELAGQKSEPIMPESVELDYQSAEIYVDETKQLAATVLPLNARDRSVTWISCDTSVATVSPSGLVSALDTGQATITATTVNGLSASCLITVNPIAPSSITLDITELRLDPSESQQLTETVLPASAQDKSVTWTSGNTSVATVSASGLVTAIAPGKDNATITAQTVNGLTATCAVTVPTIEMLFNELESFLSFGYDTGKFYDENAYDKAQSTLENAKKQYGMGHFDNAIKQLENMIDTLLKESGKGVDAVFANDVIDMIEKLIDRLS